MEAVGVRQSLRDRLHGRRVLVTGHTGFMGSWLVLWLEHLGAEVSGLALDPPTRPSNYDLAQVSRSLNHDLRGDIRRYVTLADTLEKTRPEVVFHLAAQPLVREGYRDPITTLETNIIGTANLLDAIRRRGQPCAIVVATSDKCYENREQYWGYRECDPVGGTDPYSASKGCAELVVASYRRSFFPPDHLQQHGVAVATARAGNAIGGGDWSRDRIVVDTVTALTLGRSIKVRNPQAVRPWQHVLEPLSGYLELAARLLASGDPELCGPFNFGPCPEDEITVAELVQALLAAWGSGCREDGDDPASPAEASCLRLATDKAAALLGWRPRWRLAEAIGRTVAWYRIQHLGDEGSMRDACIADITAYEDYRDEVR